MGIRRKYASLGGGWVVAKWVFAQKGRGDAHRLSNFTGPLGGNRYVAVEGSGSPASLCFHVHGEAVVVGRWWLE